MTRRRWNALEVANLVAAYPDAPTADIAASLGRTDRQVYAKAASLGLKKSAAYLAGGRSAETRFKAGRTPQEAHNYLPIGSLRVCANGYLERKMTDDPGLYPARRWVALHRLVWEAAHGPVPAGHIVVFKTGMKTTVEQEVTLDRLECITRAENMARNTYHQYPKEIAQAIQLKGVLTRQINKRSQT